MEHLLTVIMVELQSRSPNISWWLVKFLTSVQSPSKTQRLPKCGTKRAMSDIWVPIWTSSGFESPQPQPCTLRKKESVVRCPSVEQIQRAVFPFQARSPIECVHLGL